MRTYAHASGCCVQYVPTHCRLLLLPPFIARVALASRRSSLTLYCFASVRQEALRIAPATTSRFDLVDLVTRSPRRLISIRLARARSITVTSFRGKEIFIDEFVNRKCTSCGKSSGYRLNLPVISVTLAFSGTFDLDAILHSRWFSLSGMRVSLLVDLHPRFAISLSYRARNEKMIRLTRTHTIARKRSL